MKTLLKALGVIALLLVVAVAGALTYVKTMLPDVGPASELTVERTPERIVRGEYLANHVMLCMDCHAVRDWSLFAGPPTAGTLGSGGDIFDQKFGFPGRFVARNITPHGIGDWTDGELYRAITTGVSKDGHAFFPIMPYKNYSQMDPEDIYSVIAYIRGLDPVVNDLPVSEPDFPFNFIINTIPAKAEMGKLPVDKGSLEYGAYIANAAGCNECHTKKVKGEVVGELFAGGFEFPLGGGTIVRSMNITPHETGIGRWTEEQFIARFKMYSDSSYLPQTVKPGDFQTAMPWIMYSGMDTADLAAIYRFLRTVPAVENTVERFTPGS
ncbi:MAG: cytochrome c [Flavobacteriales bacterium]|nr:cytochrome c [Flavobacteriales bacterium]